MCAISIDCEYSSSISTYVALSMWKYVIEFLEIDTIKMKQTTNTTTWCMFDVHMLIVISLVWGT